jgi:MFS family permease
VKPTKSQGAALSLAALTGINLFNYLDRQILPAVLTPLKEELHLTDGQLGSVAVAFMLGYFITSPFFGYLGDRWPRKWLVAAGVLVWSVGTVLSGRASGYVELILFRVLVGLGEASYGTISPGWIADLYPAELRNNALSIFYVAIPVGSALGYVVGGAMATHFGWRSAFLWAGAPGLVLALALLLLREPDRGASETAERAEEKSEPATNGFSVYLSLWRYRAYVWVVAGYTAQTFALGGFSFWAPTFLQRVHGMPLDRADHFFGLSLVVTGLLATLLGGYIATAWQRRNPAGYAWVLGLSAVFAVPAAFAAFLLPDTGWAKVALIASMFFLFLSTGPTNTLIVESVPVAARASAMAASIFCIHLFGDLFSPKIVGMISDLTSSLQQAVLILPVALGISALFWLGLALKFQRGHFNKA